MTTPNFQENYLYNPGFDLLDKHYLSYIIKLNNIIEKYCYNNYLPIYQYGDSIKLKNFIWKNNPEIVNYYLENTDKIDKNDENDENDENITDEEDVILLY